MDTEVDKVCNQILVLSLQVHNSLLVQHHICEAQSSDGTSCKAGMSAATVAERK